MKLVVTGGTGHLGRAACHAFARAGHEVVAASRSGRLPAPLFGEAAGEGIRALALDLSEDAAVDALAAELGPTVGLVHLAAWHPPSTAHTTAEDRRRLVDVNVLGTMRALDAARKAGASVVVYASSFEVYGEPREAPVSEAARTYPLSDYGATKLAGEHHAQAFTDEEGIRSVSLRMPAVYGPGETTSRALPNFLRRVAAGERPVIFGDGLDQRDQLHVRDAAAALAAALERGRGPYNVADGAPHSVAELARVAMKVAGLPGAPEPAPREKRRRDFHMSIERARAELAFAPAVPLEEGMAEELAWLKSEAP
ncbi:MAG TPA: NAD(P)-dependent oxidoreductase [Polyangiaceae bacterium LLY-WYZ-15_(1-7)]|nr:NAD(P)-dependent oxidoreductase [Polyangiaceae bacterium LLY-WYZ-15_(1-7)]HJL08378.1 NAD(P)-dependent oxidoreductase [Polyangiaceae bacterium LLY-WYZ-15_(1-7)]HJL21831.1 NAD(P)-dependent oxidoreductase [Polyangiaceae bacterium LLY-WYZ-15_(1-7)]HJL29986.1 NAD(P)-dependent oxidoreductase [Polyangiaceae bacterium LLY-WYZ-15_(1-7)]HJL37680.1 NAD(P)-dependent oxidoreductase [Polyangiaceae bacterium LLY-WYZ-15_(1-7)]